MKGPLSQDAIWAKTGLFRPPAGLPVEEADRDATLQVTELASALGVCVHLTNSLAYRRLSDQHQDCDERSPSPMWMEGFVCLLHHVVVAPAQEFLGSDDPHVASQLLHEVGHVVRQSFSEDKVASWEVYAAMVLFGVDSTQTKDVIEYLKDSGVDGYDAYVEEARERLARDMRGQKHAPEPEDEEVGL